MSIAVRHFSGQHGVVNGKYNYVFDGTTCTSNNIFDDVAVYDTEADRLKILDNKITTKK